MFSSLKSNQYYAFAILVFSTIYLLLGLSIEVGFFNGSVGPHHWVIGVGICLLVFSCFLFWQESNYSGHFPRLKEWFGRLPFVLAILLYAELLPMTGFLLTTPILMTFTCLNFGARPKIAIVTAIIMTLACYLLFDILLGISLPFGLWWR